MDLPHAITTKNGDHGEKLNKLITNDWVGLVWRVWHSRPSHKVVWTVA
jgi:hypothetical protein